MSEDIFDQAPSELNSGSGDTAAWKATAGIHQATCVGIADMGMQESEWQGVKKVQRKLQLCFALNDQEHEGEAITILSSRFTASLHEKSALTKFLSTWGQTKVAKIGDLVGKQAMLIVGVDEEKGYVDIAGISAPIKGQADPELKTYLPKFWFSSKEGVETGWAVKAHPDLVIPGVRPRSEA